MKHTCFDVNVLQETPHEEVDEESNTQTPDFAAGNVFKNDDVSTRWLRSG